MRGLSDAERANLEGGSCPLCSGHVFGILPSATSPVSSSGAHLHLVCKGCRAAFFVCVRTIEFKRLLDIPANHTVTLMTDDPQP